MYVRLFCRSLFIFICLFCRSWYIPYSPVKLNQNFSRWFLIFVSRQGLLRDYFSDFSNFSKIQISTANWEEIRHLRLIPAARAWASSSQFFVFLKFLKSRLYRVNFYSKLSRDCTFETYTCCTSVGFFAPPIATAASATGTISQKSARPSLSITNSSAIGLLQI